MVGEKQVPLGTFGQGVLDNSIYNGDYIQSHARAAGPDSPLAQSIREVNPVFGSCHTGVVQFCFCDGSVHALPVSINPNVLGLLATINDGEPIPDY
jgi:prepilin-type processing-associated H-X9-DG protein